MLKQFLLVLGGQTALVGLREVDRSMSLQVSLVPCVLDLFEVLKELLLSFSVIHHVFNLFGDLLPECRRAHLCMVGPNLFFALLIFLTLTASVRIQKRLVPVLLLCEFFTLGNLVFLWEGHGNFEGTVVLRFKLEVDQVEPPLILSIGSSGLVFPFLSATVSHVKSDRAECSLLEPCMLAGARVRVILAGIHGETAARQFSQNLELARAASLLTLDDAVDWLLVDQVHLRVRLGDLMKWFRVKLLCLVLALLVRGDLLPVRLQVLPTRHFKLQKVAGARIYDV